MYLPYGKSDIPEDDYLCQNLAKKRDFDQENHESEKLPEESHSPNRIYAVFNKKGNDVQAIAKYGPDGKNIWEIHTNLHNGIQPHFHPCKNGPPIRIINKNGKSENETYHLDAEKRKILEKVRNYGK